jgi:hypothetical protein
MATYYSDHFSSDGISRTTRENTFPATGRGVSKVFSVIAYAKALALTTDVIRMFSVPSGCRVLELLASADDAAAAGAFHVGLHKSEALGGAVIDANLFGDAIAKDAARVDALIEATTITKMTRGQFLWQMADAGDGTYTKDPNEIWDVTITPSTSFTTTANGFLLEAKIILGS